MTVLFWGMEYMVTCIESILCFVCSGMFVNEKDKRSIDFGMLYYAIVIAVFIMGVNHIELFSYMNGIVGIVVLLIAQFMFYHKKYGVITLLTLSYSVIVSAIDFITLQTATIVLDITAEQLLYEQSIQRSICVVCSKIILMMGVYIVYKYMKSNIKLFGKDMLLMGFIASILIALNYYIIEKEIMAVSHEVKIFSIMFFVVSIILLVLIFGLLLKMGENYEQRQEIALLELQNDMLIKAEENTEQVFQLWRSSIHDYKHKIIAIKHWLDEENMEELRTFIEQESESISQKVFYVKTGNDVVDAIVNKKQSLAEEKGIIFSMNIVMPSVCRISDVDMVCILGNLIDNAIEACEKQKKGYIDIRMKEVKNLFYIKIVNSCEVTVSNELTTKKEKVFHGIGLKNVKTIVEKYGGSYEMIQDNNEVITTIMILNK